MLEEKLAYLWYLWCQVCVPWKPWYAQKSPHWWTVIQLPSMSEELHPIRHISKAQNNSFRRKTTSMHTMHYVLCHGNRQCDKKFNVTHKLGHTRERPHSCNSCEKAFSQINSLKCHILSHTGENAPSVENLSLKMAAFKNIKRFTREKSQTNATNVTMHVLIQVHWENIWKPTME